MAQALKNRQDMAPEYKWHIEDLYSNDAKWREDYDKVKEAAAECRAYKGRLEESADTLYEYLRLSTENSRLLEQVYVYANQKYHEDTGNGNYQKLCDMAGSLMVNMESANSFFEPEVLSIDEHTLALFFEERKELAVFKRFLEEITRKKPHTLSAELEELLAEAGDMAEAADTIFSMFDNADIRFPVILNEDGKEEEITHGRFVTFLRSTDRRVRKDAFMGLYHTYDSFKNTLAAVFSANVKKEIFYAKSRRYASTMERALNEGNIPVSVYSNLIDAVHEGLPLMHRYMALRKIALGVDELHMYDLYTPMVENVEIKADFAEAKAIVKKALLPLGEQYGSILEEGFSGGWIDVFENKGKRSGAYSWGAYGTHPFVLLNYQDNLDNVFTLAHEMGHAIHSHYSDHAQTYIYAGYRIFVAEVASTVNEALLMHSLIKSTDDKKKKAFLINHHLEQFRTTFFRQTMFAEFERNVHRMAEEGETLTADVLCGEYRRLNIEYFGEAVMVDPEIDLEWARIPHFYNSFYVYQYATGYSAAAALSKMILEEGPAAVERYIREFLSGGSSKDPIDLLKAAGVDMSTQEPVREAIRVFSELLDQMEALMEQ